MLEFLIFILFITPAIWATKYFYYLTGKTPEDSEFIKKSLIFNMLILLMVFLGAILLNWGASEYLIFFTNIKNIIKYMILSSIIVVLLPHLYIRLEKQLSQKIEVTRKEKISAIVIIPLMFIFTLFICAPITMYANNANELWFPLMTILPVFVF